MSPESPQVASADSIHFVFSLMEQAWNTADVSAYAQLYTEDVGYVNRYGALFEGRAEVSRIHAEAFTGRFRGTRLRLSIRRLRFLSPTVAVAQLDVLTKAADSSAGEIGVMATVVLTQQENHWLIAALQVGDVRLPQ